MKSKKFLVRWGVVLAVILLITVPFLASCPEPTPPPPTEAKTLKIGVVFFLGWSLGLDAVNGMKLVAEMTNDKGGLVVDGERYNIELIVYDSKFTPEPARAAVERLINQDKVKFIVGDEMIDVYNTITEANKVLTIAFAPNPALFNPDYKYTFQGSSLQTSVAPAWGWFAENNPDVKTVVCAFPDNKIGHIRADVFAMTAQVFGQQMLDIVFYPPEATDLGVVGTKVKTLNPDSFNCTAGGVVGDSMGYKAVWQAGYEGKIWSPVGPAVGAMVQVVPAEALEGLVLTQNATELSDPPPVAKEFRDAWIAKYGKWESPQISFADCLSLLLAGLKQANSIDPDKVAAVIADGLEYEGLAGPARMISRPDAGNYRTVDTLFETYMVRVEGGKAKQIDTISLDEGYAYNKTLYGWK